MEFKVKVCHLDEVSTHPNADKLDVARIGGWQIVVGRGRHRVGEKVAYIPEQALVPEAVQKVLGVEGRLAGSRRNRVKAIRLRKILSQGLILPFEDGKLTNPETGEQKSFNEGEDVSGFLGITKYEPPVPVRMEGQVYVSPVRLPRYDVENWKSDPKAITPGTRVLITEKLHGTLCVVVFYKEEVVISSKGLAAKNLGLKHDEENLYHKILGPRVSEIKKALDAKWPKAFATGVIGEIVGRKIQDLNYGHQQPEFYLFEVIIKFGSENEWKYADFKEVQALAKEAGVRCVPLLGETECPGGKEIERANQLADGKTAIEGVEQIREGVVLRTPTETRDQNGDRSLRKIVSGNYLTRKGGTEYR
ncbi:MAG: RNA ligase (ATP) [Bdellovibrionales bacterium]|nr:RNA ligase (ATP) [Bdellovibrionales bacterium]